LIAVLIHQPLVLVIAGGVFVMEAVSVILQRGWFRYTKKKYGAGRRIFLMAPIHHHFEKKGWYESQVVMRFYILCILFAVVALSTLKRSKRSVAGPPLHDDFRTMPYAETESLGGTAPLHFHLYAGLPDALISAIAHSDASGIEVRHWGGAMARPAPDAGPVGHREVPFSLTIDGSAADAAPLAAFATGGSFLNFLHDTSRTAAAYTPENFRRLREVKRAYDPQNVFHRNHNIRPA